jgi:hypothetical protein
VRKNDAKEDIFDAYPEVEVYLKLNVLLLFDLKSILHPPKAILFGSKATGQATKIG